MLFGNGPMIGDVGDRVYDLIGQEVIRLMEEITPIQQPDTRVLQQLHVQRFAEWAALLREGFNLVLFGMGSKRTLAEVRALVVRVVWVVTGI